MDNKMTTKIYITRDLRGDNRNEAYFWNQKPRWDASRHYFECPKTKCECDDGECSEIVIISAVCDDLNPILSAIGIQNGTLKKGQCVEITAKIMTSQGITLAQEAKELAKKIKSKNKPTQTELLKFLKGIEQDEKDNKEDNDDEDDEEEKDERWGD